MRRAEARAAASHRLRSCSQVGRHASSKLWLCLWPSPGEEADDAATIAELEVLLLVSSAAGSATIGRHPTTITTTTLASIARTVPGVSTATRL